MKTEKIEKLDTDASIFCFFGRAKFAEEVLSFVP